MSKDTLQLPKTAFSMKASLPIKEPQILEKWEKNKIFEKIRKNLFCMMDLLMPTVIFTWAQLSIRY